jgi:L-ascorbate metabolism protein UlaG (beta-lactamase superfamily)
MKHKLSWSILLPLLFIIIGGLVFSLSSKNHSLKHKGMNYLSINTDTIQTESGIPLYITFLKHSSLILTFKSCIIYVDPLSEYLGDFDFPKASYIFITHEHYDHFDKKAINQLSDMKTNIVLNSNCAKLLGKGLIMMNNDRKSLNKDIFVQAVPAYNTTPGHLQYHPKGRDNGYVFTIGGTNVYISGDTEDIPELSKLKNIDICFLPVNQPYTMTLEQANKAVRTIHPKVFYPYHYSDTPVSELKKLLQDKPEIKVIIHQMQ